MWFKFIIVVLILIQSLIIAQQKDSINTYDLDEVTVESGFSIEPKPSIKFDQKFLTRFDGRSLFETGYFMPSIKPQTNSRGESLFYIRGSNERQLGLFFDGAFINIPWDNRIDLSLLPTTSISGLKIIKGIPSVIYGANHIAGVIIGTSQNYQISKLSGNVSAQFGDYKQRKFSLTLGQKINDFSFMLSASHYNRDTYILPQSFESDENADKQRINSYQQTDGLFAKLRYDYNKLSNIQISFQYLNSIKGVPPEIDVTKPRYWQYPLWNKIGFNVLGKHSFSSDQNSFINYVFNIYNFKMQIDEFSDNSYSTISNVEKNNDIVLYGRIVYTTLWGSNSIIRFSFSGYNTNHKEKFMISDYQETTFIQNVYSAGVEYEFLTNKFVAIIGTSLDGSASPKTGNYDAVSNLTALGLNLTSKYHFENNISLQLNLGKKSRFPSLRESFSDGLERFIINPNLKPETAYDGEFGLEYLFSRGKIYSDVFLNYLNDGIVREVVSTDFGSKFMRVNKESIRTYGFEFQTNYTVTRQVDTGFQFSYLRSFAKNETTIEYTDTLEYKPELISSIYINYSVLKNLAALLEVSTIQNEYGYQEGYQFFRKLPSYYLFNFRLTYSLHVAKEQTIEFYGRVNNIFDELYYTQWGLPEAGRQFTIGANYEF